LITASMGGNKDQLKEMDRVLGSVQSCNWVTEAMLETAAQSTSRVVAKIDSQLSLAKMFADTPRSASVAETIYTQSGL